MPSTKKVPRSIALTLLGLLFYLGLAGWFTILPFAQKLSGPENLKVWMHASGMYQTIFPLASSQLSAYQLQSGQNPLLTAGLNKAINDAITPQVVEQWGDRIVDSTYKWLNNESKRPEFTISLSERKTEVQASLKEYVKEQLAKAPRCQAAQLRQLQAEGIESLQSPCLPPGQDADTVATLVVERLFQDGGALSNVKFDARAVIPENITETTKAPTYFYWFKVSPIILFAVALVSMIAILLIAQPRRRGYGTLAHTTLGITGFGVAGALGAVIFLPSAHSTAMAAAVASPDVAAALPKLFLYGARDMADVSLLFGTPLFVVSLVTSFWLWHTKGRFVSDGAAKEIAVNNPPPTDTNTPDPRI